MHTEVPQKRWLQKVGVAGFVFFLVKGLVWVALAVAAAFTASGT